ncbi:MAG: alkaline phosphatase family protein [Rhodospirillales bacterium]
MRRSVCRAALAVLVVAAGLRSTGAARASSATPIQHVIIIIQENRSFDTYFGTYPGANGITPGTCLPLDLQDRNKGCVTLFHNPRDYQLGGNHDAQGAQLDLDDGITRAAMDGFVAVQAIGQRVQCAKSPKSKNCSGSANGFTWHDVAGYQTADDIPNYWSYAQHFVLQDAMFPGIRSWSTPAHVDLTSEWMAECVHPGTPRVAARFLPYPVRNCAMAELPGRGSACSNYSISIRFHGNTTVPTAAIPIAMMPS